MCACESVCVHACVCARACVCVCVCACMRACARARMRACVHVCVCLHAWVCVCVCVCVCAWVDVQVLLYAFLSSELLVIIVIVIFPLCGVLARVCLISSQHAKLYFSVEVCALVKEQDTVYVQDFT